MTIDTLGGYRLVRKLGDGSRAELFLGYPHSDAALARPVALKVYRTGVTQGSVIAEAEALSRAAGDHVVELYDLALGPSGVPSLVLERLSGGSLARLLRDRAHLDTGETITILAPLAQTLARLHTSGVVHGGLRLEAVTFDSTGAPVLACFGRSTSIEAHLPPVRLEAEAGVARDLVAFESIALAVLERLAVPLVLPAITSTGWLTEVAAHLFESGTARAVRLNPDPEPESVPARLPTDQPVVTTVSIAEPLQEPVTEPWRGRFVWSMAPEWLDLGGLTERLGVIRRAISTVRTRVWAAAGAVAAALLVALVVVPGATAGTVEVQSSSSEDVPPAPALDLGPVAGDDPVLALPMLLDARARCIRDLSILCLDDVDQRDSAAESYDQQLVREVRDGVALSVPITVDAADLTLEERLGDSALISLGDVADGEPASVLLIKGEAGWRIRDYLEW